MSPVHVDQVEPNAGALRHDFRPGRPARTRDGCGHQPEVARAVVGQNQETVFLVVDRILDVSAARLDHDQLTFRRVTAQEAALARHLAGARDQDEALALRWLDAQLEALVVLLEDKHVLLRRGAETVPPYLVGAPRRVGPRIAACPAGR